MSLFSLGYCKPGLLLQKFSKFYIETSLVHCNTNKLTHQGYRDRFILADLTDQYTPCKIPYLHKCTIEQINKYSRFLIIIDLVSFCDNTVVNNNCIQADAILSVTHANNCLYKLKHFP